MVWASKLDMREAWIAAPRATSSDGLYDAVERTVVGAGNADCSTDDTLARVAVPPTVSIYISFVERVVPHRYRWAQGMLF
jgi:hypothetical protein